MTRPLDVAVLGMGVGGLAVAAMLGGRGHRVVMYDRMSAPGPVGSGFVLQPTGLEVMRRMGLHDAVAARGATIARMLGIVQPSGRTVLDVGYRDGGSAIAIQRRALFDVLYAAAVRAGAGVEISSQIAGIDHGRRPRPEFADGRTGPAFDLVIDAMGHRSPTSDRSRQIGYGALWATVPWDPACGFDAHTLEQRYRRATNMAGVLPVGTAAVGERPMATVFWSIRHGDDATDWKDRAAELWPEIAPLAMVAEPTLAAYRHHTRRAVAGTGVVRIGDAWHATSPQLGQGANMALLDALSLSSALEREDVAEAIALHVRARRTHVAFYQALSYVLTPFYQSDGRMLPAMRDGLVAPLLRRGGVVHSMISSMVSGGMLDPVGAIDRRRIDR
jgi:2-polyprenyl-6-methoxyphenol hydroxylase-like FAD-dependent oxidoreductase